MYKFAVSLVLAVFVLALVGLGGTTPALAAGESWTVNSAISIGCASSATGFNVAYGNIDPSKEYYQDTMVSDGTDTYMDEVVGPTTPSDGTWYLYNSSSRGRQTASFPIPDPVTVTFTLRDSSQTAIYRTVLTLHCSSGSYSVVSSGSASEPGPDMVYIPPTAVVGAFVVTTPIYFAPQADAATTTLMEAGKTVYVYGVDASGKFYKVMLAGKFFWVPVSTMGPNYDAVWQGRPLPTDVVK